MESPLLRCVAASVKSRRGPISSRPFAGAPGSAGCRIASAISFFRKIISRPAESQTRFAGVAHGGKAPGKGDGLFRKGAAKDNATASRVTPPPKRERPNGVFMIWTGKVVAAALAIYAAYAALLFFFQRSMLYPRHSAEIRREAPASRDGFERFWIEADGSRCEAWLCLPGPRGACKPLPAVILAHGNAESIDFLPEEFDGFLALGMAMLVVEYPGYGRSGGSPSEAGITSVFVAAYDRLAARSDIDAERIVLAGRSLGGGAVCRLVSQRPAAALILISTFTRVDAFAARFLLPKILVRDRFDNLAAISQYGGPVLVIHGRNDPVIPFAHGRALARRARRGALVAYDCGHNDCPPDRRIFWRDLKAFLKRSGVLTPATGGNDSGENRFGG